MIKKVTMPDGSVKAIDMLNLDQRFMKRVGQSRVKPYVVGPRKFDCQTIRYLHLNHGFSFEDLAFIGETSAEEIAKLYFFRERSAVDSDAVKRIYKKLGVTEYLVQLYVEDWANKFVNKENMPCCLYKVNEEGRITNEAHWFSVRMLSTMFKSAKDILIFQSHDMSSASLQFFKNDMSLVDMSDKKFLDKAIYLIRGYEGMLRLVRSSFMYMGRPEMVKVFTAGDNSHIPFEVDRLPEDSIIGRVVWKGSVL